MNQAAPASTDGSQPSAAGSSPTASVVARTGESFPSEVDAIVIGAGSGGLTVAVGLSRFGKSVLLVERAEIGGDCTNVGCIPSKSLLHLATEAREYEATALGEQGSAILARVRHQRDQLREEEEVEFSNHENLTLRYGDAELVGPGQVAITTENETAVVRAENVILATGSQPVRFDLGAATERIVTNEELFELDSVPARLAIVGGGAVGLEMAAAFADLGSKVIVIEGEPRIAPPVLPAASAIVQRALEAKGVEFLLGTQASGDLAAVTEADQVLLAVGRRPNSQGLGLDLLGVDLDDRGHVIIDERGRTSVEGIWAIGDVANRTGTTHGAGAWGRRVVKSIIARPLPAGDLPVTTGVIFTDPELATIGEQPDEPADDVRRIEFDLRDSDRGFTDEIVDGVIIVDVRRLTGTILGATIAGPRAGELIAVFALAMNAGIPLHKWAGTVWPYPTYADALGKVVDLYMGGLVSSVPGDAVSYLRGRFNALIERFTGGS